MLDVHPTQLEILAAVKRHRVVTFSVLRYEVGETSDNMSYHLGKMIDGNLLESPSKGLYRLGIKGLQLVNSNLDKLEGLLPAVSCMLVLTTRDDQSLVMKKLKQPNLGDLHHPTFSLIGIASIDEQLEDFCTKYNIVVNDMSYAGVLRKTAVSDGQGVFDKVFLVYKGSVSSYQAEIRDRQFLLVPSDDQQIIDSQEVAGLLQTGGIRHAAQVVNQVD